VWDKQRVLQLRRSLSLTQAEFARELGCRQQTVSEWEQGLYLPANAYGQLLDQFELRNRMTLMSIRSSPPSPHLDSVDTSMENIPENAIDKPFDPAID